MAETYKLLSTVSYVFAIVFLALAIFLFYKFNIRKIIGDLSGRNARKSINAMKGKVASNDSNSKDVIYKREIKEVSRDFTTERITQQISVATTKMGSNSTMMFQKGNDNATTALGADENATTVLGQEIAETAVLSDSDVGTTVLSSFELRPAEEKFIVEKEIIFMHGNSCLD
ncbi:MAG: hypothetical protein U0L79_09780 [Lachnospiraceae bacterium]|nr:hypothetical protein [Lachnospiraceae bacterium]